MDRANPYAASLAQYLDDEAGSTRTTQAFVGFSVGVGLTYAVLMPLGCTYLWLLVAQGVPTAQLYLKAYNSVGFLLFSHVVGFATTIVGGYWSARIGRDHTLIPATLAGLANVLFVGVQYLMPYDFPQPGWSRIVSLAAPLPAFLFGAMLARRLRARAGATS